MLPSALIDLHCDTLTDYNYAHAKNRDTLDDPARALSLSAIPEEVHWAQFFAVFVPDELRGQAAIDYYESNRLNFQRQMQRYADRVAPCRNASDMEAAWRSGRTAAFLTVENGSALAGDLSRAQLLAQQGVRCMTLVWNGENEIGSGHETDHGLSAFGRTLIPELERCGILVDVSHLNDRGFDELLSLAQKPFTATHSNARTVCGHKRNLTDEMIREMVRRGCLIGLNYYVMFLDDQGIVPDLDVVYRHISHFLDLGAGACLALGSDFDGAVLPECLNSPRKAAQLYEYLLARGIDEQMAEGIMYRHAQQFFEKNLR